MLWILGLSLLSTLAIGSFVGIRLFLRNRDKRILLSSRLYEMTRGLLQDSRSIFYQGEELIPEYLVICVISSEDQFSEFLPDAYMRAYVAGHHEFIEHVLVCAVRNSWAKKTVFEQFQALVKRSRFTRREIQLCRHFLMEQLDKRVDIISCRLRWECRNADSFAFQTNEKVYDNRVLHDMLDEVGKG